MASSTRPPAAGANDASAGNSAWSSTGNIFSNDSSFASTASIAEGNTSKYLVASDFGFSIPSNATISGIEVLIDRKALNASRIKDYEILLIDTGGVQYGNNKADTGTYWPTTAAGESVTYGASNDVWGASIDYADVNASTFGVAIRAAASSGASVAYVDYVKVTIHYQIIHNLEMSVSQDQAVSFDLIRQINLALSVSQDQTLTASLAASMFLAAMLEQVSQLAGDLYYTRPLSGVSFSQDQTLLGDLYYNILLSSVVMQQDQTFVGGKLIGWGSVAPETIAWTPVTAEAVVWTGVVGEDETWT